MRKSFEVIKYLFLVVLNFLVGLFIRKRTMIVNISTVALLILVFLLIGTAGAHQRGTITDTQLIRQLIVIGTLIVFNFAIMIFASRE